jgi:hypothetical protein
MNSCTGMPVYRVDITAKSSKGSGGRGCCAECNMQTSTFCIVCKRWFCDPQLTANRSQKNGDKEPKFIKISFSDGNCSEYKDVNAICAIFSSWHKAHQAALEDDGALERGWHCYESE